MPAPVRAYRPGAPPSPAFPASVASPKTPLGPLPPLLQRQLSERHYSLQALPEALLFHISKFMGIEERLQLERTSRFFRDLVRRPEAWRVISFSTLRVAPYLPLSKLQKVVSRAAKPLGQGRYLQLIHSLDCKACKLLWAGPTEEPERAEGMAEWVASLLTHRSLRHLRLGWLSMKEVQDLLTLPDLIRLEMDFRLDVLTWHAAGLRDKQVVEVDADGTQHLRRLKHPIEVVSDPRVLIEHAVLSNHQGGTGEPAGAIALGVSCHAQLMAAAARLLWLGNVCALTLAVEAPAPLFGKHAWGGEEGPKALQAFTAALAANVTLQRLEVSAARLTGPAALAVVDALTFGGVQDVALRKDCLDAPAMAALAAAISDGRRSWPLRRLALTRLGPMFTAEAAGALANALLRRPTLQALTLDGSFRGDNGGGVRELQRFLRKSTTLRELTLKSADFFVKDWQRLAAGIQVSPGLQVLTVKGPFVNGGAMAALASALAANPRVRRVEFVDSNLFEADMGLLASKVLADPRMGLRHLTLHSPPGVGAVIDAGIHMLAAGLREAAASDSGRGGSAYALHRSGGSDSGREGAAGHPAFGRGLHTLDLGQLARLRTPTLRVLTDLLVEFPALCCVGSWDPFLDPEDMDIAALLGQDELRERALLVLRMRKQLARNLRAAAAAAEHAEAATRGHRAGRWGPMIREEEGEQEGEASVSEGAADSGGALGPQPPRWGPLSPGRPAGNGLSAEDARALALVNFIWTESDAMELRTSVLEQALVLAQEMHAEDVASWENKRKESRSEYEEEELAALAEWGWLDGPQEASRNPFRRGSRVGVGAAPRRGSTAGGWAGDLASLMAGSPMMPLGGTPGGRRGSNVGFGRTLSMTPSPAAPGRRGSVAGTVSNPAAARRGSMLGAALAAGTPGPAAGPGGGGAIGGSMGLGASILKRVEALEREEVLLMPQGARVDRRRSSSTFGHVARMRARSMAPSESAIDGIMTLAGGLRHFSPGPGQGGQGSPRQGQGGDRDNGTSRSGSPGPGDSSHGGPSPPLRAQGGSSAFAIEEEGGWGGSYGGYDPAGPTAWAALLNATWDDNAARRSPTPSDADQGIGVYASKPGRHGSIVNFQGVPRAASALGMAPLGGRSMTPEPQPRRPHSALDFHYVADPLDPMAAPRAPATLKGVVSMRHSTVPAYRAKVGAHAARDILQRRDSVDRLVKKTLLLSAERLGVVLGASSSNNLKARPGPAAATSAASRPASPSPGFGGEGTPSRMVKRPDGTWKSARAVEAAAAGHAPVPKEPSHTAASPARVAHYPRPRTPAEHAPLRGARPESPGEFGAFLMASRPSNPVRSTRPLSARATGAAALLPVAAGHADERDEAPAIPIWRPF